MAPHEVAGLPLQRTGAADISVTSVSSLCNFCYAVFAFPERLVCLMERDVGKISAAYLSYPPPLSEADIGLWRPTIWVCLS